MNIYISLTSIFQSQDRLYNTLCSIIKQTLLPNKIYIYLSEEPYMLDYGFKDKKITDSNLLKLINDNSMININWVKNTGPYRKLVPILKDKFEEDCIIITIDDDIKYHPNLIENLVNDYYKHKCCISYRAKEINCNINNYENINYAKFRDLKHNNRNNIISKYFFHTGVAGVLYHTNMFENKLIFDELYKLAATNDDVWFNLVRMTNNIGVFYDNKKWMIDNGDQPHEFALSSNFNCGKNGKNTEYLKSLIKELGNKLN